MSCVQFKFVRGFAPLAASAAFVLCGSVSHLAMAACAPVPTNGADVITCNDATTPAINADAGDDTVTINATNGTHILSNGAATRPFSVTLGMGNDTLSINGGTFDSNVIGNAGDDTINVFGGVFMGNISGDGRPTDATTPGNDAASTVTGNDIITFWNGTVLNGEIQGNNGDDIIRLYGGQVKTVEGNAAVAGDKIYLDGADLGEWESSGAGTNGQTLYMRSGTIGLLGEGGDDDDDDDGPAAPAGIAALSNLIDNMVIDPGNSIHENPRKLRIGTGFDFAGGNDTLTFKGAVNEEGDDENFEFEGAVAFIGGAGLDKVKVEDESSVVLGDVSGFEEVKIEEESKLRLTGANYTFGSATTGEIEVEGETDEGGASELHLSGGDVTLTVGKVELGEAEEGAAASRLAGLSSYYDTFATGGIFRIGAAPAGAGGDDEGGGDDDDDDDEGGAEAAGPSSVTVNTALFENHGTITMMNGIVGDSLTINGDYEAHSSLALDSELGDSNSPTDTFAVPVGAVLGTTTVLVNNVGGKGAFTGQGAGDGIKIIEGSNLDPTSFELAANNQTGREEVLAGPFAYRLVMTDDAGLLQSDVLDQVPAYTSAPSVAQRYASLGLDTLYKRLGEIRNGQHGGGTNENGLLWVRGNYSDVDIDASKGYDFSLRSQGVLFGANAVILSEGASRLSAGVFGGVGKADSKVDALIFGTKTSSSVELDGWSAGGYLTYSEKGRPGTGLYIDGVFKVDIFDLDMAAGSIGARGKTEGEALTASAEVGYGVAIGGGLVVQPQAQIGYTDTSVSAFKDSFDLESSYGVSESLLGRVGVQVQANLPTAAGLISPYAIFNAYSEFEGDNTSEVSGTTFASDVSGTWYSAGGGVNAQLATNVSVYGSGEYDFGDVQGWQGTGGVKVNW